MSFELNRSRARAATLLIILGTVVSPIVAVTATFLRLTSVALFVSMPLSILSLVGFVLFMVAMNGFANYYRTPAIFKDVLYGFLAAIVGGAVFVLVVFGFLFVTISPLFGQGTFTPGTPATSPFLYSFIVFVIAVWLGAFLLALIQSIFYKRAFDALGEKSSVGDFKTAGQLMLIGGALTIIFVGVFVYLVGWIYAVVGFFSMKSPQPQTSSSAQSTSSFVKRYCSVCGAANDLNADYCSHCGNKL